VTDAYKIGITVAVTNLVSAELLKIIGHFGGAEKAASGFAGKLALIGGAMAGVAAVMGAGVEEARKFQLEATRFASLGFGDAINSQAQAFAIGMNTLGTSATQNMALVSDAMAVFKDLGHAEMAAPLMSNMKFANETVFGAEGGAANERKFMDMLKVIEFRGGLSSDQEFSTQANFVQKVISGSRNRVDAGQLLQALKTGGVSLSRLGNEAFYLGSEPLIQEFGGFRYGTANMSMYQNLAMMRAPQQALTEMMRLGLLDKSKVEMNQFTGGVKRAAPGAFRGADVLETQGDLAFLEQVLLPAFASKGITSDQDVLNELGRILSNRTGSSLMSRVYLQRRQLHTQMEANKGAMDIGQLTNAADLTLDGKMIELHTQWADLMKKIGDTILPSAISGVGFLADALKKLVGAIDWLQTSPVVGQFFGAANPQNPNRPTGWFDWFDKKLGLSSGAVPDKSGTTVVVNHQTTLDSRPLVKSVTTFLSGGTENSVNGNGSSIRDVAYTAGH
jgi:hypothetical protein